MSQNWQEGPDYFIEAKAINRKEPFQGRTIAKVTMEQKPRVVATRVTLEYHFKRRTNAGPRGRPPVGT